LTYCLKPAQVALVLMAGFVAHLPAQNPAAQANRTAPAPQPRRGGGGAGGNYKNYDSATLEAGKKTFTGNCAFCHGSNAKGGETGPDLLRSILVLHDENGEAIGPVVLNGRPDKGMPKFNLSGEQISQIAAFLHDGVRAAAMRGTYQILNIVVGDAKAGEAYFNGAGTCTSCHSVTGDLAHVGSKYPAVELQQKFVMPREGRSFARRSQPESTGSAITVTVTLPSGEAVNGRLERIDDFSVSLIDASGDYRSFVRDGDTPKVELHDPLKGHTTLLSKYTDSDIHNLTAYLLTLK
jgi:mono/diheme cytochrome c family protein